MERGLAHVLGGGIRLRSGLILQGKVRYEYHVQCDVDHLVETDVWGMGERSNHATVWGMKLNN